MAFPHNIDTSVPTPSASPLVDGANEIRKIKNLLVDLLGLPSTVSSPLSQLGSNYVLIYNFKPSNSSSTVPGVIRWTGSDWEGFDGQNWVSLTTGSSSGTWINKKVSYFLSLSIGGW